MDISAPAARRMRQPALIATTGPLMERLGAAFFAGLPRGPGVYRFYGEGGRLLYVGQSGNLRARVGSYRHVSAGTHPRRIVRMVAQTVRAEWEPCASAADAIALESRLLREHAPPFNRAGVWQPLPCWLVLTEEPCETEADRSVLCAHLIRATPDEGHASAATGPLPSGFRYTFAALLRCAYRWQWPGTQWWNLPCGMARNLLPPQITLPLPVPARGDCAAALHRYALTGCPAVLQTLVDGIAALDPDTAEGMFWTADADTLASYAAKQHAATTEPRPRP